MKVGRADKREFKDDFSPPEMRKRAFASLCLQPAKGGKFRTSQAALPFAEERTNEGQHLNSFVADRTAAYSRKLNAPAAKLFFDGDVPGVIALIVHKHSQPRSFPERLLAMQSTCCGWNSFDEMAVAPAS